jgi:inhibitor of KinA
MIYDLQYSRFNDCSVLIEWPAVIDDVMLKSILNFKMVIENSYVKQNIEVITTYNSILVVYEVTIEDVNSELLKLKALNIHQNNYERKEAPVWEIPVCYSGEFGMDLESYSKTINMSKPEIIKRHSETIYTVFFIGFLPGFLYLGGLDPQLFLDRKTHPNLNVKKGSVAIGGNQTGIYPQDSPGGWHIIGNSPIELFDSNQNPPCLINAGDRVKFVPVETLEYLDILNAIRTFQYQLKSSNTYA